MISDQKPLPHRAEVSVVGQSTPLRSRRTPGVTLSLVSFALAALACFAAARLGLGLAHDRAEIAAIAPAAGVALALLLLGGLRLIPAVAAGALAASLTIAVPTGAAIGIAIGETVGPLLAARLLRGCQVRASLERISDVVWLAVAAGVASAASAAIGVASLGLGHSLSAVTVVSAATVWWLSALAGYLVVGAPLLILARGLGRRWHAWIVAVGGIAVAFAAVGLTARGHGPFAGTSIDRELIRAQVFVCLGALIVLLALAAHRERHGAQALAHQASHDSLTGLPNRTLFLDRLEHALARARRSHAELAVVFLDLDDFKLVNDTQGHEAGDRLLLTLAPRLSAALRPADTIARFGGDEFVVLCEDLADEDDALHIARRMANACSRPVTIAGHEYAVTVSAGVAMARPGQGATASDLLRDADAAMYRAKSIGKGQIEVFDDGMRARLIERISIENGLRRALERGELRLLYQPVVSLADNRMVGAEALLRWDHPERGLLEPADFIAVAESTGLIVPIGRWVIDEACRQAAAWHRAAPDRAPIHVSVNLSPRQVLRSDVVGAVAASLRASGLDPALLELEIEERLLLEDPDACARVLGQLKALGVGIVLDDFGSGYSSLSHLSRLAIDSVKIDRSLVNGLVRQPQGAAIVEAVLSMADALDVGVTAEGVETAGQLTRLRAQGCEFAQGYLFSRPAGADEVGQLLGGSAEQIAA
jgi:diguanylate cyclase (GGDEF)-like protein